MTNDDATSNTQRTNENTGPEEQAGARETGTAAGVAGNVTGQARQTLQAARDKTGPITQQAQRAARELATKVRTTATSEKAQRQVRGGGITVAAGAVLLVLWLRRRRARRLTRRRQVMRTAQRTGTRLRGDLRERAAELGAAVRDSETTAQAAARAQAAADELAVRARQAADELAARARHAADAPEAKPRMQGAAMAAAALLVVGCLRRTRAARRNARIGGP
jgi:hypothetical protein